MIHADFETYSDLNVSRVGAFKYAEHPSTEVLILCWSYDDEEKVHAWWKGKKDTDGIEELFERVEAGEDFGAHNAQFEYAIWNYTLQRQFPKRPKLRRRRLRCTAARAAMCSLPRGLERAGAVLGVAAQKDKRGSALIKMFCSPRKPTKRDPRTRILPREAPELFREFIEYCRQDVRAERAIDAVLPPLPPFEQRAYLQDLHINERGIPVDVPYIKRAIRVVTELERRAKARVNELTKGINPTQRDRLMEWLATQGFELENLQAQTVKSLLEGKTGKKLSPEVRELLELRVEASKVSTKKLLSMLRVACEDGRVRGTLLYHGAHTGRAAGKLVQPQNFIRGLPDTKEQIRLMAIVFKLLETGDADTFEMLFDNPLTSIAQCMRGFIRAKKGKRIIVVDYAQIEARLLVWLSDEADAVMEYVRYDAGKGHDRYVLMAAFLWQIKPDEVSKDQRRIAKNLVLGCGFGLGWKKFIEYCAKADVIIDEDMSQRAVKAFREKHPSVVQYWNDVERCAVSAVRKAGTRIHLRNVSFFCDPQRKFLTIRLPSGRELFYPSPALKTGERFGRPTVQLTFMAQKKGLWVRVSTYGGRLVENIVQGIARDVLVMGGVNMERGGYPIVLFVHDELLAEMEIGRGTLKEMCALACDIPDWIGDCPIAAEGFETERYRKG